MQFRRFQSTLKLVSRCPPPKYDTGCTFCQPPPELDLKSPPFSIRNTAPPLAKHVIVLSETSNKDWPKKVEAYPVMRNLGAVGRGNGNLFSMSTLCPETETGHVEVLVYPDSKKVTFKDNSANYSKFVKAMDGELATNETLSVTAFEKPLILICGHAERDVRCGVVGELVHDEFEKVLHREKLNVELGYISHIGGHVYAGNVLIYKPNGTMVWYGMVRPQHVQGIVTKTVKADTLIEELLRN
ncbi:hypothetical protein CAS74_004559 [Pichia kudriavzevii]|uniref:Altered inheritance of mitochondria protein 32 n=1 Tax=Pichia kudriavzevii TaxID=4909 RepID=A0A099P1Y8_PICKU|nr:uncharacterized protein C5L36_0B12010 [Pichia kudriavzevii]AWU75970.1 hypothetical protein C5L36_0B12010 [Pichia kudriavzevii]KGK39048.1 hypothetical protein JL09_g1817 [Pichia kudriavzevii]ONH77124.1 Altered inheritance of mitochondria protein 32 [Pichia kudriavzevii]OUT20312.1 hypothetical protein CAS74_004559 [Pichia kudriavzevii]